MIVTEADIRRRFGAALYPRRFVRWLYDAIGPDLEAPMVRAQRRDELRHDFFAGACPETDTCRSCPAAESWTATMGGELGWCCIHGGHVTNRDLPFEPVSSVIKAEPRDRDA